MGRDRRRAIQLAAAPFRYEQSTFSTHGDHLLLVHDCLRIIGKMVPGTIRMNTTQTVTDVLSMFAQLGFTAALCGGWAEQAFGLTGQREHRDIDLVIEADDFSHIDRLFSCGSLQKEIVAKRSAHKRAFIVSGTMVEMYLVQHHANQFVTLFWGDVRHTWLDPLVTETWLDGASVWAVTQQNLVRFRRSHQSHQPWRWRDPASRVMPA